VSYQYDAAGNRTQLSTQNQVIDYTFDDLNRLETVKPVGSSVPIATYDYDGVGNRDSVTHDNGVITRYTYNRRNRLTGIQHKLGATLLLGVAYTLDASGLRTGITETGQIDRSVAYTYDGVKRLTSESVVQLGNDRRTSWTYDRTGNRLTQTKSMGPVGSPIGTASTAYVYDANDRLETEALTLSGTVPGAVAGTTNYTYDAAGNTTRKVSPTETLDYVYDDANRLAELQTLAGDVTRYAYAHDGIRLSQTSDATGTSPVTTHYLIDPNQPYAQVIEEATQSGTNSPPTLTALYAVGDDRIRRFTPAIAGSGSNPGIPAGLRYYHADGLGSTRLLTNDTGALTDHYAYEAFGELDAASSQQASGNAFLYTGEQLDPNSGFYYLRARYMSPASGRFTQQDSFTGFGSDPITLHKYAYANSSPSNYTDPSGNITLGQVMTVVTVVSVGMNAAQLQYNVRHYLTAQNAEQKMHYLSGAAMNTLGLFLAFSGGGFIGPSGGMATAGGGVLASSNVSIQAGQVVLSGVIPVTQATMMSVSNSGENGSGSGVDLKDSHVNVQKHELNRLASSWDRQRSIIIRAAQQVISNPSAQSVRNLPNGDFVEATVVVKTEFETSVPLVIRMFRYGNGGGYVVNTAFVPIQ
jgi:RHS repeat-associated protein